MKMNRIFTPASKENADQASELLYATMGKFADATLGMGSHELCMLGINGLFKKRGNRFSHDSTHLLWQDEKTAGLLLSFPGWQFNRRAAKIGLQAWSVYGFNVTIRMLLNSLKVLTAKETEKDEYYIAHLAVHPDFRRMGIGNDLIDHAAALARQAGLGKVSLIVEIDNDPAIALYQKAGFEIIHTTETPELVDKFHTPGFHRMVKNI